MSAVSNESWSSEGGGAPLAGAGRSNKRFIGCLIAGIGVPLFCVLSGFLVVMFGSRVLKGEIREALEANIVIQEQIGEIEHFDVDWSRSFEAAGDDSFVFEIRGKLGAGHVLTDTKTGEDGAEVLRSGLLTLDTGEEFDLLP